MLFLHRIINGIWFIEHAYADNFLPLITRYISAGVVIENSGKKNDDGMLALVVLSSKEGAPETKSFHVSPGYSAFDFIRDAPEDSILILSLTNPITKYDQECGPAGMNTYAQMLKVAYISDNIKGIALKIDSGGGEGTGMRLMAETIMERNKPVIAYIDDFAASAAYGIASACDYITANSSIARIGSIGCYLTIADYSEYFRKQGIAIKEIYAPQSKDKNKEYYEAISGNTKPLEEVAAFYCEDFIAMVEKNRAGLLTAERDVWATGKVFFADKAIELGLVDNIDTFENFLNYFNT